MGWGLKLTEKGGLDFGLIFQRMSVRGNYDCESLSVDFKEVSLGELDMVEEFGWGLLK